MPSKAPSTTKVSRIAGQLDPGLYFTLAEPVPVEGLERIGPFSIGCGGQLSSRADDESTTILLYGLLLSDAAPDGQDAGVALTAYRRAGLDGVCALDGMFNALVIEHAEQRATLINDLAASQPMFLFQNHGRVALAPSPLFFRRAGLSMTFNRQALYESLRFQNPYGNHSLIEQVERLRPAARIEIDASGTVQATQHHPFDYRPDPSRDLDAMAEEIRDLVSHAIAGVIGHPKLRDRPVELSLTGGMDSRHILGELIEQGHPPKRLRHIHITDAELRPVELMAAGLDLPLDVRPHADIDHPGLTRRWLQRCGGLTNYTQYYLLHMMEDLQPPGVVGFDGYLMDWFLGIYPKKHPDSYPSPAAGIWQRRYTSDTTLKLLMPQASLHARVARRQLERDAGRFDGPKWFKYMMLDYHSRGIHHTGPAHTMMADDAIYLSPGASRRAVEFYLTSDYRIGGEKRAKLLSMQRHFPSLAGYPDPSGKPYAEYASLRKGGNELSGYARAWLGALRTGFKTDPAPQTRHEWFRRLPFLRDLSARLVSDSSLTRDGHVTKLGLEWTLRTHRLGAYEGWTWYTLAGAEAANRVLVHGQSVDEVVAWMAGEA